MSRFFALFLLTLILLAGIYRLDNRAFVPTDTPRKPYLQQVHDDSALICWRMRPVAPTPLVEWRRSGADSWITVEQIELEEGPGPFNNYLARLKHLPEHAPIEYRVLKGDNVLGSGTFLSGMGKSSSQPLKVWVLGDSGTGKKRQYQVAQAMAAHAATATGGRGIDLMLHVGDMAYSHGTEGEFDGRFFRPYVSMLSDLPCWPAIGNHEVKSTSVETESGPYFDAFMIPTAGECGGEPSGTEAYYSFNNGPGHFISLDSSGGKITADSPMVEWLKKDLASHDREWCIVFFHHPPYSLGTHTSQSAADSYGRLVAMREIVIPLLEAGGADLILAGHSHCYERSALIRGVYGYGTAPNHVVPNRETLLKDGRVLQQKLDQYEVAKGEGSLYVVVGHGGAGVGTPGEHPVMDQFDDRHGSLLLTIDSGSLLLENVVIDGDVMDRVTLVRPSS
ncbi:hypothetical protein CBD41_09270 [bacterium TMED181]|nr:hypothetical protein [Planctomycetota bacterium]OUW42258.1 MAG: hypothetical protein CBD41_09270 [bacterium TMED181]